MTRLYARTLIALGLAGILVAGTWLAAIGVSASPLAPPTYYACPEGGSAHVYGCPYVDWGRKDLIRLAGPQAASSYDRCEHCCPTAEPPSTASARSRLQVRAETESPHQ